MRINKPLVSVLGTSYSNSREQIKRCLDSLKKQNYDNLEFIFVLEPNQKTNFFFLEQKKKIKSLKIIINKKKLGFVKSLNKGIKKCKGKYIGRIDFDDYFDKTKITKQVNYMESAKKVGVCGTGLFLIDARKFNKKIYPKNNFFIKLYFYFYNSIAHSSVLIRTSLLKEHGVYNENFKYAEDLELWLRLLSKKVIFYNLAEPLTYYSMAKKPYLRIKENFIYNLKARKKHSCKIYGNIFGAINIKIFKIFISNFKRTQKILNWLLKI
jgi:cellulose synthase/poly-beta-1,6-N-acetylglucosamine synthase-like glycosyltransferase